MKRSGSITVIVIYISFIIFLGAMSLVYYASLQALISNNLIDFSQSKYILEDKLYELIYDGQAFEKYFLGNIFTKFRGGFLPPDGIWKLNLEGSLKDHVTRAEYSIEKIDEKMSLILQVEIRYKKVRRALKSYISLVNNFFENGESYIFKEDLSNNDEKILLKLFEVIQDELIDFNKEATGFIEKVFCQDRHVNIEQKIDRNRKYISVDQGDLLPTSFRNNAHLILSVGSGDKRSNLTIGNQDDNSTIEFSGTIYVEGDLIINQDLDFDGIILVNNGDIIVNSSNSPKINGMLIHRGKKKLDEEDLDLVYNYSNILKAGSYLPGFVKPKIELVKVY